MAKKKDQSETPSQISPELFAKAAKPLLVDIDGKQQVAGVKQFSTGSLGWYSNDKMIVVVDGVPLKCTVATTIIVINSKAKVAS